MTERKIFAPYPLADYRIMRPAAFLEKGGDKVIFVQQVTLLQVAQRAYSFPAPNAITLFYNKSWKELQAAKKIYYQLIQQVTQQRETLINQPDRISQLYDYLEHIQTSVITIFSALEALSNVAIPETYTHTKTNGKGIREIWDKAALERWSSTEEKIGKIVPEILQIKSPKTLPEWELFKKLKDLRDAIIHQKQSHSNQGEIESGFHQILLDESVFTKIMAGFALINYFCEKDEKHRYFPMLKPEILIAVDIIDSIEERIGVKLENIPPVARDTAPS
jgi:hypothetical protein